MNDNDDDDGVLVATHKYKGCDEWILDSGCSFHITPNKSLFSKNESIEGWNVNMENNTICKEVSVGSVQMKMFDGMMRTLFDITYKACFEFEEEFDLIRYLG